MPMADGDIPPPPPNTRDEGSSDIKYAVCDPWRWVMDRVSASTDHLSMVNVTSDSELSSWQLARAQELASTPLHTSRRSSKPSITLTSKACTLRADVMDADSAFQHAVHGTSCAFDGMEDKDELVRTFQRCRCGHLNLSPPSILISWDVRKEECRNVVGENLPILPGSSSDVAVLKEPMGSRGEGIYFVSSSDEIYEIMEAQRKAAVKDGSDFLDTMIAEKGRIPSWVLQAEIYPPLLIQNGKKFHIRSYVITVEKLNHPEVIDVYLYNRHEVRIAGQPVEDSSLTGSDRDRKAHITNASVSNETTQVLLQDVPELASKQDNVELFVAQIFGKHVLKDMQRRVIVSAKDRGIVENVKKFAIAGLDIMMTSDYQMYLLEANISPVPPPEGSLPSSFQDHLVGFMSDLLSLILGRTIGAPGSEMLSGGAKNFTSTQDILDRQAKAI